MPLSGRRKLIRFQSLFGAQGEPGGCPAEGPDQDGLPPVPTNRVQGRGCSFHRQSE